MVSTTVHQSQGEKGLVAKTYNVIASDTVGLAPGAHNVSIIVGQNGNNVDTLGAQLGELLNVLGNMVGGADGGESTCRVGWRSAK